MGGTSRREALPALEPVEEAGQHDLQHAVVCILATRPRLSAVLDLASRAESWVPPPVTLPARASRHRAALARILVRQAAIERLRPVVQAARSPTVASGHGGTGAPRACGGGADDSRFERAEVVDANATTADRRGRCLDGAYR